MGFVTAVRVVIAIVSFWQYVGFVTAGLLIGWALVLGFHQRTHHCKRCGQFARSDALAGWWCDRCHWRA